MTSNTGYTAPTRKTEFVAYTLTPKRFGNAETGEATDFRSSVFLREVPSVMVKAYENKSGEFHGEVIHWGSVTFDAASLDIEGFKNDFGGQVEVGTAAAELLERAHREGKPVMVAIETVRRGKNKSTGVEIECTDYIHDLRGAQKDGQKGNSNMTGDACKNRIVGVGPAGHPDAFTFTSELTTDPAEWPALRTNTDHTLPPTGWRVHKGGIIPTQNASHAPIDVDELVDRVVAKMKPIVTVDSSQRPRPPQRDGVVAEAKEWEPWNRNGAVNLGGYLLSKERAVHGEAHRLVTEVDPTASVEDVWNMVPVLMWIADTVQANAYGPGAAPNRAAKSHFEASRWAAHVYDTLSESEPKYAFTKQVVRDLDEQQAWARGVVDAATALFRHAAANVEAHLTGQPPQRAPEPAPVPPQESAPTADSTATHTPATSQDEASSTAATPALVERYDSLLTSAGQAGTPERFHALLERKFGSWQMSEISHDAFEKALTTWEADVDAFIRAAFAAWEAKAALPGSGSAR